MSEESSQERIPIIPTYKINVYIGTELHTTTTVFSLEHAQDIINYYTARGYTAEIVE